MPQYSYTAKDLYGKLKSGVLEAESESELSKTLKNQGYFLIDAGPEKKAKSGFSFHLNIFSDKISLPVRLMLTSNLRFMVKSGLSLPRALNILSRQTENKNLKRMLIGASEQMTKGATLHESLRKYPSVFPEFYCNMIKVGEESGTLDNVLENLKKQLEKEHELKSKIKGAMTYPVLIFSFMLIAGILMIVFIVPKFVVLFESLGASLPLFTKILFAASTFLAKFWYAIPIAIFALYFSLRIFLKTASGKSFFDYTLLKIPVIGKIARESNTASTTRVLSSLIASGVPIVRSLEITSETLENIYYKKAIKQVAEDVRVGSNLSESLRKAGDIFPDLVSQMAQVGEETGETSIILSELADFFEKEVIDASQSLSSIIEPILIITIGVCVGLFAVSMIQPIYSSLSSI